MPTYREKLKQECPEALDDHYGGGAAGCPRSWGYEKERPCIEQDISCEECWNRKIMGGAADGAPTVPS